MSGRAGRRGIDLEGFTVIEASQLSNNYVKDLVNAQPASLQSQFRIGYNLVASLSLDPAISPTEFLDQSFYYYQIQKARDVHNKEIKDEISNLDARLDKIDLICEKTGENGKPQLSKYAKTISDIKYYERKQQNLLKEEFSALKNYVRNELCVPGRLVFVRKLGWSVCVSIRKHQVKYYVKLFSPKRPGKFPERMITNIKFSEVILEDPRLNGSQNRITAFIEDLKTPLPTISYQEHIIKKRKELLVQDEKYQFYQQQINQAKARQEVLLCYECPLLPKHLKALESQTQVQNRKKKLKRKLWPSTNELFQQFEAFEEMLIEWGYLDNEKDLTTKGLILSQISNEHDLLLVDWLFSGKSFEKLSPAEINGLLASFVSDNRIFEKRRIPRSIKKVFLQILDNRKRIIVKEKKKGIECESLLEFNLDMYEEIFQWSQGQNLDKILSFSSFSEGQILSTLRRLINLLLQFKQLPKKYSVPFNVDEALRCLRRGEALVLAPKNIYEDVSI